ncbi:MAG: hypothetical protein V7K54_15045 [Nostoc sp.]
MKTAVRHSPCPNWLRASGLLTHPGRLRLLFLDQRQSLLEYIPIPEALNEVIQDFRLIKRAIRPTPVALLNEFQAFLPKA